MGVAATAGVAAVDATADVAVVAAGDTVGFAVTVGRAAADVWLGMAGNVGFGNVVCVGPMIGLAAGAGAGAGRAAVDGVDIDNACAAGSFGKGTAGRGAARCEGSLGGSG